MPSTFTWLDTSEADRRRALDVIDLFKRRKTRDELGIGSVRDALSDHFFPGTSTIQTRARYFLFIPWIYQRLERRETPSAKVGARARRHELRLAEALAGSKDPEGAIGAYAGQALQRLPSTIYWGGLGVWGIRLFDGSQEQYHRAFDRIHARRRAARQAEEGAELRAGPSPTWHPHLPGPPEDFPGEASFDLREEESVYLQDRIHQRRPGTLLATLVDGPPLGDETSFFWEHPLAAELPAQHRSEITHARLFSLAMHGAALLYNLMLAEALPAEDWIEEYRDRLAEWTHEAEDGLGELRRWDRPAFWRLVHRQNPRIPGLTRRFADAWMDALCEKGPGPLAGDDAARQLIRRRERLLKGPRARLASREHLELWGGASGTDRLSFRWGTAQRMLKEIQAGLGPEAGLRPEAKLGREAGGA